MPPTQAAFIIPTPAAVSVSTASTRVINIDQHTSTQDDTHRSSQSRGDAFQQQLLSRLTRLDPSDLSGLEAIAPDIVRLASDGPASTSRPATVGKSYAIYHSSKPRQRQPIRIGYECDQLEAARIQKLYRGNRRKAMEKILKGKSVSCSFEAPAIRRHLSGTFSSGKNTDGSHLIEVGSSFAGEIRKLTRDIGPAELAKRLHRMSNTAQGSDQVRYSDLKRIDPGCLVLLEM